MGETNIAAAFYRGNKSFSVEQRRAAAPGANDVSVRVAYCGICGTDMHVFHGNMDARVGFERVIGHEMSGVVDQVGSAVSDFRPGDKVVVRPLDHCGNCPAMDIQAMNDPLKMSRTSLLSHRLGHNVKISTAVLCQGC